MTRQSLHLLLVVVCAWLSTTVVQGFSTLPGSSESRTPKSFVATALGAVTTDNSSTDPSLPLEQIVTRDLELSADQYQQLQQLAELVVEWNERINLVSRKDCTVATVWERHILPSIACTAWSENPLWEAQRAIDVGTGGGFPGLPLAICFPNVDFVLLDSVGKKLTAVQDMAQQLQLSNVQIHHGRAEEYGPQPKFCVATGRSVSNLPQFCGWMQHLLQKDTGRLLYWIGGDLETTVTEKCVDDIPIGQAWIPALFMSCDKRVLQFPQPAVTALAQEFLGNDFVANPAGIQVATPPKKKKNKPQRKKEDTSSKYQRSARGAWKTSRRRLDNEKEASGATIALEPKQRGYEGFQRYDSAPRGGPATP
mmetsp:Transcript_18999/g.39337  ORF Transcript_18999/g.39337 Transcript_18999/m.39337 type:complete len:366 (-) Transcript_18999:52-1149(-)